VVFTRERVEVGGGVKMGLLCPDISPSIRYRNNLIGSQAPSRTFEGCVEGKTAQAVCRGHVWKPVLLAVHHMYTKPIHVAVSLTTVRSVALVFSARALQPLAWPMETVLVQPLLSCPSCGCVLSSL